MARKEPETNRDNWSSIEQRSSPFQLAGNRNAAHPVSAILNYAYTVLKSEVRIKAIAEGYDPSIGIMHEGRDGTSKFVFDSWSLSRRRWTARSWTSLRRRS